MSYHVILSMTSRALELIGCNEAAVAAAWLRNDASSPDLGAEIGSCTYR